MWNARLRMNKFIFMEIICRTVAMDTAEIMLHIKSFWIVCVCVCVQDIATIDVHFIILHQSLSILDPRKFHFILPVYCLCLWCIAVYCVYRIERLLYIYVELLALVVNICTKLHVETCIWLNKKWVCIHVCRVKKKTALFQIYKWRTNTKKCIAYITISSHFQTSTECWWSIGEKKPWFIYFGFT